MIIITPNPSKESEGLEEQQLVEKWLQQEKLKKAMGKMSIIKTEIL